MKKEKGFKNLLKNIVLLTLPSLLILFFIVELFFRYVIPASQIPLFYFDPQDQILRYDEQKAREGLYTIGKLAEKKAHWRINNMGWNSDIDYRKERTKPLIAIIGDSYIEALQVDIKSSYPSLLRSKVDNKYDVYSFGISGASLSQYLQMSRYVTKHFDPEIIVFNVVHNDFLESLCAFKPNPGWLCIEEDGSVLKELLVMPPRPSKIRRLLWHSSIVRYFVVNLKIKNINFIQKKRKAYDANIDIDIYKKNNKRIELVTDYILKKIRLENENKRIIFLIDAPRKDIYSNSLSQSRVLWLNKLLEERCNENDFYFIDMTDIFLNNYERNQKRFESSIDFHWNEWGHYIVAETLYKELKEKGLF